MYIDRSILPNDVRSLIMWNNLVRTVSQPFWDNQSTIVYLIALFRTDGFIWKQEDDSASLKPCPEVVYVRRRVCVYVRMLMCVTILLTMTFLFFDVYFYFNFERSNDVLFLLLLLFTGIVLRHVISLS